MSGPWEKYNGIVELGNIDLNARPVVKNDDGSISTVRSMGVNMDGVEVLIPTVSDDGRLMSDREAINTYRKTGRHLGKFKSVADSNAYAESLHQQQEKQYGGNEGPWSKYATPAAVSAGKEINSIPRQLGLTARYGIEGVGNAAQIVSEPLRYLTDRLTGSTGKTVPAGVLATRLADTLGLPSPQGANERTIAEGTKMLAGAGGMGGVASLGRAAPGLAGEAARLLSSNMPQQLGAAAGAGLAGGASREAGGGTGMQTLAALGGGVVGGLVPGGVTSLVNTLKSTFNKLTPQQIDQQISAVLQRADVDYSALPQGIRNSLRDELKSALQAGKELDPKAVARLADFKAVGATPTRGMVSQNPVQITREMNLAKIGANSSDDTLQGLPMIQNQNNNTLIRRLNEGGAAQGDPFMAGQSAIGSINAKDAALEQGVSSLYKTARDTQGRSLPLDHVAFTTKANQALDEAMVGGALPADVANTMNKIAKGEIPLTVEIAEQIKTRIGALQRATNDGAARMALGTVRRALDDTPLLQAQQAVPGQQSIDAFNQARNAARQRFGWQESGRPIEAALNGAQPDKFVQQFVIGGTLDDAKAIAQNAPIGEVKNAILAHLKDKALNGAADEVGKFSQSAFNKAVNQIGERKLALFFSPQELAELKAVGRVASYMQAQPVGSAVNNSNSGALLLGRGLDLANRIPVVGPMLVPPLKNIEIAVRNSQARNVAPSLLMQQPTPTIGQNLLLPGLALGGSLAAP